jgi:hypothetical protein
MHSQQLLGVSASAIWEEVSKNNLPRLMTRADGPGNPGVQTTRHPGLGNVMHALGAGSLLTRRNSTTVTYRCVSVTHFTTGFERLPHGQAPVSYRCVSVTHCHPRGLAAERLPHGQAPRQLSVCM